MRSKGYTSSPQVWVLLFVLVVAGALAACSVSTPTSTPTATPRPTPTATPPTPTAAPTPTVTPVPTSTPAPTSTPVPTPTVTPPPVTPGATGALAGQVTVGPLCPVEPCPTTVPNPYIGRSLILEPVGGGNPITVKLQNDGVFRALVPAAEYDVRLLNCDWLGCARALPRRVTVPAGQQIWLDINIDTGIR